VQSVTEVINGLFFKPVKIRRRKCIVVMHEGGLVLGVDKFMDLVIQLGKMQVEGPDGLTIFVNDVVVLPQLLRRAFRFPISG
jgi:hypothetical protein